MHSKIPGIWLTLVLFAALALLAGCSTKSTQEGPSSDEMSLSVSASPTAIEINETSVIEASVTERGSSTAVSGQLVTFQVEPSTAGNFTPAFGTTDANGLVGAVFTSTDTGAAVITAFMGDTYDPNGVLSTVAVSVASVQQAGEGNVNISLSKNLLLADGSDSAVVTVTVRDALGQPVPDSTLLAITAGEKFIDVDKNGYFSQGIDTLVYDYNGNGEWDAFGLVPSFRITEGGAGQATFTYFAGSDAATVYLRVTVADPTIGGTAEMPLQLTPTATINAIFLDSDSLNLVVKSTGGIEIAMLHAIGYDVNGNTVPEGQAISFIITDGPGGGEHLDTLGPGPYTVLTNSQGKASIPLHSGTISGTIRIRAYADSILSNATQVMVSAGPPAYVVVGAKDCNVDYWDNIAEENAVTAVVSDIYLNPVTDSTVVYFSTDEGTMKSHEGATVDLEGTASSKWIAGNQVPTADGRVMIYAETAGGTVADTAMFFNTHYPDTLIVSGVPSSMLADGDTKYYIWVSGYDLNDNPVIGGTSFKGEANFLSAAGGNLENGCYGATARVELKSATLDLDYSVTGGNDDGIGALDYVTYWHPAGAVTTYQVAVTTGTAYRGNSGIESESTPIAGAISYFTITVKDRWGNPLADHTLNIAGPAAHADPVPTTAETNSYGEAYFTWQVPAGIGEYLITATDTDARGGIVLTQRVKIEE